MKKIYIVMGIALYMTTAGLLLAQESSKPLSEYELTDAINQLEKTLSEARTSYEDKISKLESRIKELEKARVKEKNASELENLLREAQEMKDKGKKKDTSINRVFKGSERSQPQMNPEISMTGDFSASYSNSDVDLITESGDFTDGRNQFYLREVELNVVAPLDPFTRGKFFFGIPGTGEASLSEMVEEAYMEWLNLPGGMNLKAGLFNTQFGVLNRWHDHGLPQVDRPRALTNLFTTANFGGLGISGNFLLPGLWAHVNELNMEIISGGDGLNFHGDYDNVIGVAHLKNYYDLTRNTYMEVGFSGAYGYNDSQKKYATTLTGLDVAYKWVPAGRSHYRTTEFRSEFFFSHREKEKGQRDRFSFYSYITNKMGARFWIGLRYSYSELFWDIGKKHEWDISPTIDFWQSEFVMMRLQYSYTHRSYMENDNSIFIQSVWSMGPHKHEAY